MLTVQAFCENPLQGIKRYSIYYRLVIIERNFHNNRLLTTLTRMLIVIGPHYRNRLFSFFIAHARYKQVHEYATVR